MWHIEERSCNRTVYIRFHLIILYAAVFPKHLNRIVRSISEQ